MKLSVFALDKDAKNHSHSLTEQATRFFVCVCVILCFPALGPLFLCADGEITLLTSESWRQKRANSEIVFEVSVDRFAGTMADMRCKAPWVWEVKASMIENAKMGDVVGVNGGRKST